MTKNPAAETRAIEVRMWADLACPWCWIGHRRLMRAIERRPEVEFRVVWQPYQLQPGLPPEGIPWNQMLEERHGGPDSARFLLDHVTGVGARERLGFDFQKMTRAPNTARAHSLVLAAADEGLEWEVVERLFREHFSEGADLSDPEILRRLGRAEGMSSAGILRAMDAERGYSASVTESQREASRLGVQGVPYFLIAGRAALVGAQPVEVFGRAIAAAGDAPSRRRREDESIPEEGV